MLSKPSATLQIVLVIFTMASSSLNPPPNLFDDFPFNVKNYLAQKTYSKAIKKIFQYQTHLIGIHDVHFL